MPKRILRPCVDSERVNALTPEAECLFYRLLQIADDYGLAPAKPTLLTSAAYPDGRQGQPVNSSDTAARLDELEAVGLIRRTTIDGKSVLQIVKFGQRIRSAPRLPCPEEWRGDALMWCAAAQAPADDAERCSEKPQAVRKNKKSDDTAAECSRVQHIAAECSTLQQPAAHCRTLPHIAAECGTLPQIAASRARAAGDGGGDGGGDVYTGDGGGGGDGDAHARGNSPLAPDPPEFINRLSTGSPLTADYDHVAKHVIAQAADMYQIADPIILAMACSQDMQRQSWLGWVRMLNTARKKIGVAQADRRWRSECLTFFAELRAGESVANPGAALTARLRKIAN